MRSPKSSEHEPSTARDAGVLGSDGTLTPIPEYLAEQRRQLTSIPKKLREAAFRERAHMQACLLACTCGFPIVKAQTPSGHEAWCLGELWDQPRRTKP